MPYAVDSKKLGRTIWIAEGITQARELYRQGVRDPIFFHDEIGHIQKAGDAILEPAALLKDVFPGCCLVDVKPPGPLPQIRQEYRPPARKKQKNCQNAQGER